MVWNVGKMVSAVPEMTASNLPRANIARARLLKMHYEAKVGHIGGNLSALDAILHLHSGVMGGDDVFVLSESHSAGAPDVSLLAGGPVNDGEVRRVCTGGT